MTQTGRAWVFGDDIDTDALAPGLYMKAPLEELAAHCLETVAPDFAAGVRPGDVLVAGENFGAGSSREQAVQVLQHLGVRTLIARSFAGIFFRNALNFGVAALTSDQVGAISPGDRIAADPAAGRIENLTTGRTLTCDPLPAPLLAMVEAGGLVAHLERRLADEREQRA